mmetsp:Transcript_20567/g.31214  ORF Transcript_20567/g.31214 Transcript_20567/m.31214 type:complete len:464 (-) Transcript_20567:190-1581(-)
MCKITMTENRTSKSDMNTNSPNEEEAKSVNLLQLATHCIYSTLLASKPIQYLAEHKNLSSKSSKNFYDTNNKSDSDVSTGSDCPRVKKRIKTDGTVITDADGLAQSIIYSEIHGLCSSVHVIGEESESEMRLLRDKIDGESLGSHVTNKDETLWVNIQNEMSIYDNLPQSDKIIDVERVSVFVDPLDGTSSYAKGNYEAVTILVAIIVDNVPVFGVICKPFAVGTVLHQCKNTNCTVLYGGTLVRGAFVLGHEELLRSRLWSDNLRNVIITNNNPCDPDKSEIKSISTPNSATTSPTTSTTSSQSLCANESQSTNQLNIQKPQRRAIISKSRAGGVVRKCIDSLSSKELLHDTPIFITGAGYKTMKLLLGDENEALWFFPRPGTSLWDVAAADALLRVMGGRISDKFGKDLDYGRCVDIAKIKGSHPRLEAENEDGIIACTDLDLHLKCLALYKEEDWDCGCD